MYRPNIYLLFSSLGHLNPTWVLVFVSSLNINTKDVFSSILESCSVVNFIACWNKIIIHIFVNQQNQKLITNSIESKIDNLKFIHHQLIRNEGLDVPLFT